MAKVSLRAYNQEIEAMIDRGHLDEAVANCKHILKTFSKHLETYRLLGKAYLEYKRYPDAADIFSRVLVSVPSDFVANVGMSIIRDEENKLDDAVWHMERAFETQPSNAAIQSELQRLYGRREGVQPPRIRMTRGALAHMYVQGELYPQAISEIKGVLKEDPGRSDMQVLLARAYYRSGLKNDAAEVASAVLRNYPYSLDANRVLVEILGADHPESVQAYRQRVVELDPYAAQVTSSIFLSDEVPDAAVTLEHLDWNGQPVGMQADWEATQAISLESNQRQDEQPDWLKNAFGETSSPAGQPTPFDQRFDTAPPPSAPTESSPASAFDAAPPSARTTEPVDDIPDFLRQAGWDQSTGAVDESKSAFADAEREPASTGQPIEQGDLPDWVKAMAPQQPAETPAEEELPDWINTIGTSALPTSSEPGDQPDWLSQSGEPAAQPVEDQPDWLKQLDTPEKPAVSEDQPDWLKGSANEAESTPSAVPTGELDWLSQLNDESGTQPETTSSAPSTDEFDFLNELTEETEQLAPSAKPEPSTMESLGMSEGEQDDSFAWLENLAAKQGASEGLLTTPQERLQEEPDWVKQARGMDVSQSPAEHLPTDQTPVAQPPEEVEELGKSEQERDDSFAWLEGLAAKQGASEGLLTKPEERLEEEPEWIRQARSLSDPSQEMPSTQPPEEEKPPVTEPSAGLEELGKSEQERDDSFAWLENLAAKQGATEGLLTKPEERLEDEPDWVRHAKDLAAEQPAVTASTPEEPTSVADTAAWLRGLDEEATPVPQPEERLKEESDWTEPADDVSTAEPPLTTPATEQPASTDDTAAWLRSLDEEEVVPVPGASSTDDTAIWLKNLDEPEEVPSQPAEVTQADDLPEWMQDIAEEKAPAAESAVPDASPEATEAEEETEWMRSIEEEPVPPAAPKVQTGDLPSWLRGLDEGEEQESTFASQEDLPAWLRDETGEVVAEPTKIEPTHAADWQPVETRQPEPSAPEPEVAPSQPEPVDVAEEKPIHPMEELKKTTPPSKPYKEPVTSRAPGVLTSPDPVLGQARNELSRSNVPGALENYGRLIKKGRFLEDIIYDLREASYRYPVEVGIWQALGDAYMRANRLQDALDAYTKAEELLR